MPTTRERILGHEAGARQGMVSLSWGPFGTGLASGALWICDKPYILHKLQMICSVVSSDSKTYGLEKCTGTTAPGSGTDVITAVNLNTGIVANTVLTPALTSTFASLKFAVGDRLAGVISAATPAALAGFIVTAHLLPDPDTFNWLQQGGP